MPALGVFCTFRDIVSLNVQMYQEVCVWMEEFCCFFDGFLVQSQLNVLGIDEAMQ
jgi:hypothetical protein